MANPTTNYSFAMPTNSDLVKDLPADFEIFGQAVDTQIKTNADAAVTKATVDAKGDLIAGTADNTIARLAVGANNTILTADSSTATGLKWAAPAGGSTYSIFRDEKTSGTNGGSFTTGAWRTRDINATQINQITGSSIASNQITLPAGTFYIYATAPALLVYQHQSRFYNITDSATAITGQSTYCDADLNHSVLSGVIVLTASKVFELQHRCAITRNINGFGEQNGFGTEVYAQVTIAKVA